MPDVQSPFFFLPLHWPAHWVLLHIYAHNLSLFDWQRNLAFGTDPQAEGYRMDTSPDSMILCFLASAEAKGRTKALQKLGKVKKKKKMPPAPPS